MLDILDVGRLGAADERKEREPCSRDEHANVLALRRGLRDQIHRCRDPVDAVAQERIHGLSPAAHVDDVHVEAFGCEEASLTCGLIRHDTQHLAAESQINLPQRARRRVRRGWRT